VRKGEIRSLSEIAAGSLAQPVATAREVHRAVAGRVFGLLGPLGLPVRLLHDGISAASYRGVDVALRAPLRAGGRALAESARESTTALADSRLGGLAIGALNGVAGDRLARDHPDLSVDLAVRRRGQDVPLDEPGLADAFPDPTGRLVLFVHGLCETDEAWKLGSLTGEPRPSYGARLRTERGYTPLFLRYNTGLRVSVNGARLAAALERIAAAWPVEVEQLALVGHSMGGLVARSACHYGAVEGHDWTESLRHVFCLGTPHLGAPLEKAASVAARALNRLPESRPFGDLFLNGRSEGIKDLRFGNVVEDDRDVPFLPHATYCFIGATLTSKPDGVGGLIGDLLVHYPSASGVGRSRRIPFELENGRHLGGAHHLQLLNHPDVYEQIREWIERPPATAAASASSRSGS
jgi:pimeloyl-ACP methyl ester carboxylesterase